MAVLGAALGSTLIGCQTAQLEPKPITPRLNKTLPAGIELLADAGPVPFSRGASGVAAVSWLVRVYPERATIVTSVFICAATKEGSYAGEGCWPVDVLPPFLTAGTDASDVRIEAAGFGDPRVPMTPPNMAVHRERHLWILEKAAEAGTARLSMCWSRWPDLDSAPMTVPPLTRPRFGECEVVHTFAPGDRP